MELGHELRRKYLALENLGGEKLDLVVGEEGVVVGGSEDGSSNLPSSIRLLELNEPLIGSDAVAGLRVVIEDVDCLSNLEVQFHTLRN